MSMRKESMERTQTHPLRRREAQQILRSLEGGIVPTLGIQHLLVGRRAEVEEVLHILESLREGSSEMRLWVGDFGSGKSFMLRTIEQLALQMNLVTSTVDLTPTRRFHASDGKGLALYQEICKRLQTRGAAPGTALATILDQWAERLGADEKRREEYGSFVEDPDGRIGQKEDSDALAEAVFDHFSHFRTGGLRYELSSVIATYLMARQANDTQRMQNALRWMSGQMTTRTEAKRTLGIGRIITDDNWTEILLNWSEFFYSLGYAGWVVNFDELVNLYKLPRAQTREQNYERILNLYNETKGGSVPGLWINVAATRRTVFDERRGMASYGALKSRFGMEREGLSDLVDATSTVQILKPLTPEEIYTLLEKLQWIFGVYYVNEPLREFTPEQIALFMQAQLNRPGADEFLTPRAVIKDFLQLLQVARQNPDVTTQKILERRFGALGSVEKDPDNQDDGILIR